MNSIRNKSQNNITTNSNCMELLISLQQIILNLTEKNIDSSVQNTMKFFDTNIPFTFDIIIGNLIYYGFLTQRYEIDLYINYMELVQSKEEEIFKRTPNIIPIFINIIFKIKSQESYYLIEKMIEKNFVDSSITKNISSNYFAHYKIKKEIIKPCHDEYSPKFYDPFIKTFIKNYQKLSNNDWELHKQYVKEGVNPSEILKIIRNDEIDKLQEISSQNDFNFNQRIKPSLYERYSLINEKYKSITLIDYAAFFSAVKCFKYLLLNEANLRNTGKYAIAGGNLEIFHLCLQNNTKFYDSYETAIEFHRNEIFKYIYENKIETINNMEPLGIKCVLCNNYEIFSFLLQEGLKINDTIINEAAKIGNLYLIKFFIEVKPIPKNIIVFSAISGNIELVKFIMEQKGIYLNT